MSIPFFSSFFSYSSVAQTLKNVGSLDCKLRLLREQSISLAGKISVAEFMHLTLSVFSTNSVSFRAVLVVVASFFLFFIHFLSLFLFLRRDFEQYFFVSKTWK